MPHHTLLSYLFVEFTSFVRHMWSTQQGEVYWRQRILVNTITMRCTFFVVTLLPTCECDKPFLNACNPTRCTAFLQSSVSCFCICPCAHPTVQLHPSPPTAMAQCGPLTPWQPRSLHPGPSARIATQHITWLHGSKVF